MERARDNFGDTKLYSSLDVGLTELLIEDRQCEKAEMETDRAAVSNADFDPHGRWVVIGNCYYDRVVDLEPVGCDLTAEQLAKAPITIARKAAIFNYEKVSKDSRSYGDAQKWVQFIEAEMTALDRRCPRPAIERELCYQKIKQAYDAEIFLGSFKLDDEKICMTYKADYDAEFRATSKN